MSIAPPRLQRNCKDAVAERAKITDIAIINNKLIASFDKTKNNLIPMVLVGTQRKTNVQNKKVYDR
jgi:hypothetical protein